MPFTEGFFFGLAGVIVTALGAMWAMGKREAAVATSLSLLRQEWMRGNEQVEATLRKLHARLEAHETRNADDLRRITETCVTIQSCARQHDQDMTRNTEERRQVLAAIDRVHGRVDELVKVMAGKT